MDKKRLDYLDMVKGIGIILVVIGHSTVASDSVVTWLASFHMPLFFIVSGMLIQYLQEEQREFRTLIIRKARSIMLPYVTFSVIILLIKLYYVIATPELMPTRDFQIAIVDTFSLEGISVMWFLPALFIGEMFFFLLLKILKSKKHYVIPIVALLFAVIPVLIKPTLNQWSAQYTSLGAIFLLGFLAMLLRAFVVVAFLTMGYYIQKVAEKIEVKKIVGVIVGVIAILVTPILAFWNGRVDLHFLVFQNIVLYYVTACIGTDRKSVV